MDLAQEITSIARHYMDVRRVSSSELAAICPFHRKLDGSPERNPSFYMSTETGLWFCHGCHEKGNLFSFLRTLGVDRQLIDTGYAPILQAASRNIARSPDPMHINPVDRDPLPEGLLGLFHPRPPDLLSKGFTPETLDHFEVGYDSTHQQVVYPLRDLAGQLVGLMGRRQDGFGSRYKLYDREYAAWSMPERPRWDKGMILWNCHTVYPTFYRAPDPLPLILVEGFKAAMWVYQMGFPNVVAALGSYVTTTQQWILERMGAPIYMLFDNDMPGRRATVKTGMDLYRALKMFVVPYPARLESNATAQPDSITRVEMIEVLSRPITFSEWARS